MMGTVGVAPGTTTITLPDGSIVQLSDWIDDKLYGAGQLTNGQTNPIEVFSAGRSQTIPGGTRAQVRVDTNIPRAGDNGLPKDWAMLVYSIGIRVTRVMRPNNSSAFVLADGTGALSNQPLLNTLFQVDRVLFFEYYYNGKPYTQGVMSDYPAGVGYDVFSTNTAFELAQNGAPSPRDRIALVLPIYEKENLGYKAAFQPEVALSISQPASDAGTALTGMDIKVTKYGLVKRNIV